MTLAHISVVLVFIDRAHFRLDRLRRIFLTVEHLMLRGRLAPQLDCITLSIFSLLVVAVLPCSLLVFINQVCVAVIIFIVVIVVVVVRFAVRVVLVFLDNAPRVVLELPVLANVVLGR